MVDEISGELVDSWRGIRMVALPFIPF